MIDVYEKALDNAGRLIAGTKKDQYSAPAPAYENAKGVINHIIGGCHLMSIVGAGQEMKPGTTPPDFAADDATTAFAQGKKLAIEAFSTSDAMTKNWTFPFGTLPGSAAIGVAMLEAVVHGWDLAKATGQDHGIDPQLAGMLLAGAKSTIGPELRAEGGPFGKEVSVGADASPVDQLVGFLGRKP